MGAAYHERRKVMDHAITTHGLSVAGSGAFGGSSFWMQAPEHVDTAHLADVLKADSVLIEPGAAFFAGQDPARNFYRLAYSSIPSGQIDEGIRRIRHRLGTPTPIDPHRFR